MKICVLAPFTLALATPAIAQVVDMGPAPTPPQEQKAVANEFIVQFKTRSYDLSELRKAIYAERSVAEVDEIVAGLERKTEIERESFGEAVEALGGRVLANWWIINASIVRLDASKKDALSKLNNVSRIEPNYIFEPVLRDSTNSNNHNSDAANLMRNSANQLVTGTGLTVSILDTGIDANMGGSGRPHRSFYRNGDPNNRTGGGLSGSRVLGRFVARFAAGNGEDDHFHGSAVASCSASAWGSNSGFAPDAGIVSWKVSASSNGSASSAAITDAWQQTLANRTRYKIVAANNSYSGSPSFTTASQQALDSCAFNGNINCVVPSGNSGTNIRGTQAGYNGISVGSNNKNSTFISSFSGRGTQSNGKVVPDLVAIGASVVMTLRDSESRLARSSGTSFSSPSVAGAAVLVRHANSAVSALEAKALLINATRPGTSGSGRGAGVLRADLAVDAAIKGKFASGKLTGSQRKQNFFFPLSQGVQHSVTVTWWRTNLGSGSNNNVDLRVYDPQGRLLGSSVRGSANSYEKVSFTAPSTGTYRAEVDGSAFVTSTIDFAIADAGKATPPKKPTLTSIKPAKVSIVGGQVVTLTGTELQTVSKINIGSTSVSPKSTSATTLTFDTPSAASLGKLAVTVTNPAGTSNALSIEITGAHPPILQGSTLLFSTTGATDAFFTDKGWVGIYWLSTSNQSSKIPGLVDMGIGNNFTSLFLFHTFVGDASGQAVYSWPIPGGLGGTTIHMQFIATDGKKFPFESSNVLTRKIVF